MRVKSGINKIVLLLVLMISFIGLTGCNKDKKEVKVQEPRFVEYIELQNENIQKERHFSGVAEAETESELSFKIPGSLIYRKDTGDFISKGQVIARLDAEPYQLEVDQAVANLEDKKATELNAYSLYDKMRNLYVTGNIAKTELESARAKYESSRAQTELSRKQIESSKLKLSYTKLKAPISGVIAETFPEINENVSPGAKIVTLLSGSINKVNVDIPDSIIDKMQNGVQAVVVFDTIPDKKFTGIVSEISSTSGDKTTTYPVAIKLLNPDKAIKSGMTAEVTFNLDLSEDGNIKNKIVIPSGSVLKDDVSNYVYVVEKTKNGLGKVKRQNVEIGEIVGNSFEIISGLQNNDLIVKSGVSKINDGDIVKIEKSEL